MDDNQDREEWRRECSLRALGRAMRGDDDMPPRSLLAIADMVDGIHEHPDARTRHSLARERRQAALERVAVDAEPRTLPAAWQDGDGLPARKPGETEAPFRAAPAPGTPSDATPRRRRVPWRMTAATTVIGTCLGAAIAFSLPARYQATAELTLGGESAGRTAAGAVDSQLRVLTSGMVLTKVVDRLNLASDPEFNGKDDGAGLAGLLQAALMHGASPADDGHRQALAVDHLAAILSAAPADAGSIAVTVTTGNGEKSALIANAVADAFVEVYEGGESGAAADDSGAADARPDDAASLALARRRLNEFAVRHGLGDLMKVPDRVAEILKLDDDLAAARSRTEELNARVTSLRSAGVATAAAGLPRELETGAVEALRAQYLDLKQQADSAAVRLGPRNPELRAIEAQLAGARDRLSAELRRIVAVQQAALKQAVETEQGYAARLARTGLNGEDIAALRGLQQAVVADEVDRRTVTASIPSSATGATGQGAHVVSRAEAPLQPSGPSHMLVTLAGSMLGLLAGLGIGGLRSGAGGGTETGGARPENAESRFEDVDDRERSGGVEDWRDAGYVPDDPVVAAVPWPIEAASRSDESTVALPLYQSGSSGFTAISDPMETVIYPARPDRSYPQSRQSQGQPPWAPPIDYPPYPPQPQLQPPVEQAVRYDPPSHAPQHAYPQAWQSPPSMLPHTYEEPAPAYSSRFHPPQPALPYPPQDAPSAIDRHALDEIRAGLREFREALRELAESRSRRRIF